MIIPTVTRGELTSHHTEPKTILGFFLGFFALVVAGAVGIVVALVTTGHGTLAAGVIAVFLTGIGILVWVARTHRKDPTALMLGQITAGDYLAFQQWTAGDSSRGERTAMPHPVPLTEGAVAAIPAVIVEEEVTVEEEGASAPEEVDARPAPPDEAREA